MLGNQILADRADMGNHVVLHISLLLNLFNVKIILWVSGIESGTNAITPRFFDYFFLYTAITLDMPCTTLHTDSKWEIFSKNCF